MELTVHTALEEQIFYPACLEAVDHDMLDEAQVEHDGAKVLIAELETGKPDDHYYDAKVKVLSEEIKHHVKEEEKRGGIFSQVRDSDLDLKLLGEQMTQLKKTLMEQYKTSGLPKPKIRSMKGIQLEHDQPAV